MNLQVGWCRIQSFGGLGASGIGCTQHENGVPGPLGVSTRTTLRVLVEGPEYMKKACLGGGYHNSLSQEEYL